jgi:hypothetical protein
VLSIANKKVEIPKFESNKYGVIKGATDIDGKLAKNLVYANTDDVGEVKAISTDILVNGENDLILFGGDSTTTQIV